MHQVPVNITRLPSAGDQPASAGLKDNRLPQRDATTPTDSPTFDNTRKHKDSLNSKDAASEHTAYARTYMPHPLLLTDFTPFF